MTTANVWKISLASLCLFAAAAHAIINPEFTPVDLVRQSTLILAAVPETDVGDKVALTVRETLKGEACEHVLLDLASLAGAAQQSLRLALKEEDPLALLFAAGEGGRGKAYLHTAGRWFALKPAATEQPRATAWHVAEEDTDLRGLLATWRGGTDTLLRCVRYVLADPYAASIPNVSGLDWADAVLCGRIEGEPSDIMVVDLAGDGTPYLYIAGPQGDCLFRGGSADDDPADVTAALGIRARSLASAWGDFDGDGRLDLASLSSDGISVWLQAEPLRFTARAPAAGIATNTHTLVSMVGAAGRSAALVSVSSDGLSVWDAPLERDEPASELAVPGELRVSLGRPGRGVLADFTGDGYADLLQPYEHEGLLFEGSPKGFRPPRACGVASVAGPGRPAVGDFDADGAIDVMLCSNSGVGLYRNDGSGSFGEVKAQSGEIAYKTQRFASWGAVGDVNNDGRDDVLTTYYNELPGLFFNRGFCSFGFASIPVQSLDDMDAFPASEGQFAGLLADMDHDGAQDLVLVLRSGDVWCLYNALGDDQPLCVRVRLTPGAASPATIECLGETRSFGRHNARPGDMPTFFGVPEPGPYRLRWQTAGGAPSTRTVIVETGPVDVEVGPRK